MIINASAVNILEKHILFFWLEPKEPKVQDLDHFAKKTCVSLKDLNLR